MNENKIEVSIVIPCLNEEVTIKQAVRESQNVLQRNNIVGEVIVADNGSDDRSVSIAQHEGAIIVNVHSKGYGNALMGGFAKASGKYIIHLDADMSYDFSHIPRYVKKLRGGADLVMGSRFKGKIYPNAMPPLHRYLGTPVLTWIANLFYKTNVTDVNCGMRGLRREIIKKLDQTCGGMEFASEMIIKTAKLGFKIEEIPTDLRPDMRDRKPHLKTFRDGWRHLRFLLLLSPTWLFFVPGLTLMIFGLSMLLMIVAKILPFFGIFTGLISMAATIIGAQIIILGVGAKKFDHINRFDIKNSWWDRLINSINMELGILVGVLSSVIGSGVLLSSFLHINNFINGNDYVVGSIDVNATYASLTGATLLVVGLQVMFSSFLFGIIDIDSKS
ncbi:MAG: dolichol-P-glucose synthetase [Spirochaetales bacterium]|jgi:glycosyltransferase involved in cell wall biosynthesis|nr:dolichol-P-glucose synthetase [Spirochaetales bacterium]